MKLRPINLKTVVVWVAGLCLAACAVLGGCYVWISLATTQACYDSLEPIPHRQVGVVLGTRKFVPGGGTNLFYQYRIEAAERLFKAGKVDYLLVSGDKSIQRDNEPLSMQRDLVQRGIPANKIYLDGGCLHTMDSIVRAKAVFGLDQFVVISQKFHNERAIYIGRQYQLDVIGYNARDVGWRQGNRTLARENLSRPRALLDLHLRRRAPEYSGPKVAIGRTTPELVN